MCSFCVRNTRMCSTAGGGKAFLLRSSLPLLPASPAPKSPHHFLSLLHRVGSGTGGVVGLPPRLLLISGDGSVMCSCEAVDVPQWPTHTYHSVVYKRLTRSHFCQLSGLANAVVRALEAACLALNHQLLAVCPWAATSLSISCLNSKMGIISETMMRDKWDHCKVPRMVPGTHIYIYLYVYVFICCCLVAQLCLTLLQPHGL